MQNYTPDQKILDNLADLLVNYALNSGNGVEKGEVVYLTLNEWAKPILLPIQKKILEAGAHMILNYNPAELERDRDQTRQFYELASEEQLNFFPENYIRGRIDQIDHVILILSAGDHDYYSGVDQSKIATRTKAWGRYYEMRTAKEYAGNLTWVLTDYPTPAMAEAAGLTIEQYWDQIIKACFLDQDDPIAEFRKASGKIQEIVEWINNLEIDELHIEAEDIDLRIGLDPNNQFVGGSGRNIPSFEVFTSPDWRRTNGTIKFNQPLYRNGQVIKGIKLRFENGRVVEHSAEENKEALTAMLETDEGAKQVGEFSLTDRRLSRIDRIMANTLYDENFGGEFGNTHIALGKSYRDCVINQAEFSDEQLEQIGFNTSAIHTDIISTTKRKVTAMLRSGESKVIYEDGEFMGVST